ncbi:MAG TPA: exodeoxyribonuclease VII small subunit [Candidatus Saccharimonadales bacterium]|nr:exodeoxyribonuclease VII small subunit [Candidatus Saccharimonadales bacterium]
MSDKNNLKKDLKDLEQIVDWFESDELDLEQAMAKFDEGVKKAEAIKRQLTQMENKISVLSRRFDETE